MENRNSRRPSGQYRPASRGGYHQNRRPGSAYPRSSSNGRPRSGSSARPGTSVRRPSSGASPSGRASYPSGRRPSGGAGRRPNPPRRPTSYPRRRRKPKISFFGFAVPVIALIILIYFIRLFSTVGIGTPTFIPNVYIGDISLEGLTLEEGAQRLTEIEEEWRNKVYTLTYLDKSWTFSRAMVNADVDYEMCIDRAWNLGHVGSIFQRKRDIDTYARNPVHLPVNITYDETVLNAFIDEICAAIDVAAVDAVVVPDATQPVVVSESSTGLKVNREQLYEQLDTLIRTGEADTALPVETVFPNVNSDDVSFQVIAQFSTDVSFRNSNSRTNVRIALDAFNGITVLPGQTYSFNELVGPRDEAHGFKQATEFAGDMTTMGWGGGVCQASTTLYNALIQAGMTIDERFQHSMTVSYVDPSRDAAVSYPRKDLVFTNNTDYSVYIYTSVSKKEATVTIYGRQPDYYYTLESVIIEENVPSTREVDIEDTEGTEVYYTDERKLHSKGKPGCKSEGWLVAYDWTTRQEVSRTQLSSDNYQPGASVYYVGVHDRAAESLMPTDGLGDMY